MWKFVTRGIRESLERRACRTNVYSQTSQDGNGGNSTEQKKVICSDGKILTPKFSTFYHDCCGNTKQSGAKDKEYQNKYDAKYTWTDAVGWSSVLAVGYVVCQSLCIRRRLFEIDNKNFESWHNRLFVKPQIQASRLLNHLLPVPKYILPLSNPIQPKGTSEVLINSDINVDQPYGPITAQEALKEAVNEFACTHETILGELELDYGSKALEEKRYEDAVEHFTTGANLSSTASMFNLALCYELGLGTSTDYAKAVKYYKRAADKGHADAMYNLGIYHAQGKGGLRTNLDTARQLFTEAAKKGQTQALKALQLERSFKKRPNLEHKSKYNLEPKTISSSVDSNIVTKLMNYNNILTSDLNTDTIQSDQFINSYEKDMDRKSPTDMFLEMLNINERSAIPILSVGESGP
ncbi:DAP3-binding cell death enhancer 1 [Nasonia vitripennis]|uniref:Uncharacterized protein n=1 Tax=Nasonia vitripennis TaxID=7425 RepID=A0A7M7G444_NASVI|nr:DAP3-binding cell death enhancer 1 [Nasonia vitripennis]